MKTTVDIPEPLYKRAKIRAVETGRTLKAFLLTSLEHEMDRETSSSATVTETPTSYWANRKLRPEFKKLWDSGALSGGTDSTQIISEDRSSREDALL